MTVYVVLERYYDESIAETVNLVTEDESEAKARFDELAKKRKIYGTDKYMSDDPAIEIWDGGKKLKIVEMTLAKAKSLGLKESEYHKQRREEYGEKTVK